jgi:hypothetical protein
LTTTPEAHDEHHIIDLMGNKSHGNRILYTRGFPSQIHVEERRAR